MSGSLLRPFCAALRLRSAQITPRGLTPRAVLCGCQTTTRRYSQQPQETVLIDTLSAHDKRLYDFFRCYDLNGDGEITRDELFRAMKRAIGYNDVGTNQIVDAIYADCEKEKNDKITFEDFKKGIKIMPMKR